MPSESPWPFFLALSLTLVFAFLLVSHFVIAALCLLLVAGSLVGWHTQKPWEHEAT